MAWSGWLPASKTPNGRQSTASLAPPRATTVRPATDPHTVALWLFDEPPYPNVTLTDAGPYRIDLQLRTYTDWRVPKTRLPMTMTEGSCGLVPGKFGRALCLPVGEGAGVSWPVNSWRRYFTGFMSDRADDVPERCNLGFIDFTLEFWFKASAPQDGPGVLWEVRSEASGQKGYGAETVQGHGFNALMIEPGRQRFLLVSKVLDFRKVSYELPIPSDAVKLSDGSWHHLAFTFTAGERQMRHYVDGRLQPLPGKGTFLPLMGKIVSMRIGRDGEGRQELVGWLDEMRISDVVRYKQDFTPPTSFSANYAAKRAPAGASLGPPPLFPGNRADEVPANLGTRKHLFLDDALLQKQTNLFLTVNPPTKYEVTDFRIERQWEATPRFGPGIPDLAGIWDDGERLGMLYTNGGMWGAKQHVVCLATSRDGLHWTKPTLNLVAWDGSLENNIVLSVTSQGMAFRDPRPDVNAEERYKYVAWCMMRGFYVFVSADGIHWRRNETIALPFDPDGGIDVFWDDQWGLYRGYLRASLPPNSFRAVVSAEVADILKPWPFKPTPEPVPSQWTMPKPVSGELPLIETGGEVYRFRATKYAWAPDAYVAFPWRHVQETNVRPGSFLMTSRDGANWRRYESPYYFKPGGNIEGHIVQEALMEPGMIRRGDELWQYGTVRFTEHGGVLYGGVEHEGGYFDRLLRLVQRLDGFVSLDAGDTPGSATTRTVKFAGKRLTLNVAAKGSVRVALLDSSGTILPGFRLEDCDPIQTDSVRHTVTWKGRSDLSRLAGRPVRMEFRLTNAKIYALQFE